MHPRTYGEMQHQPQMAGFTFVELLVSTVLIGTVLGSLALLPGIIGRGSLQTERQNNSLAGIDSDLSTMRALTHNFSCCSGSCVTSLSPTNCNSQPPGTAAFYQPTVGSTAETTFNTACANNTLATTLRTVLSSQALSTQAQATGVSRTVTVDSAEAHRLRVTYTAPGNVERVAILLPTVASFCPDT